MLPSLNPTPNPLIHTSQCPVPHSSPFSAQPHPSPCPPFQSGLSPTLVTVGNAPALACLHFFFSSLVWVNLRLIAAGVAVKLGRGWFCGVAWMGLGLRARWFCIYLLKGLTKSYGVVFLGRGGALLFGFAWFVWLMLMVGLVGGLGSGGSCQSVRDGVVSLGCL